MNILPLDKALLRSSVHEARPVDRFRQPLPPTLLATYGPRRARSCRARPGSPHRSTISAMSRGESTLVAPPVSGRLVARLVERGGRVDKGDRLYVIDTTQAEAEVGARPQRCSPSSRHGTTNMMTGKRTDEMDVIRAPAQRGGREA